MSAQTRQLWDNFKKDIMHKNRFLLSGEIYDKINMLLNKIIKYSGCSDFIIGDYKKNGSTFYRARIGKHYKKKDLYMPGIDIVNDGRCTPRGIPCFYMANNIETAIKEVRPQINEWVTVAKFQSQKPLRYCNFGVAKLVEQELKAVSFTEEEIELIDILIEEFSKPIDPKKPINYIPLQYIYEVIKNYGLKEDNKFNGVYFKSSFGSGNVFAFFDDNNFKYISKKEYLITEITTTIGYITP